MAEKEAARDHSVVPAFPYPERLALKALCDHCVIYQAYNIDHTGHNYIRMDIHNEEIRQLKNLVDHKTKLNDDNLSDYNRLSTIYHDTHLEKCKLESELTKLRTQFENRVNQAVAEKLQRMVSQRLRTARAMMQKTAEDLMNIPMERYDDDPWNNPADKDGDAEK